MNIKESMWSCTAHLRISHPKLDPNDLTQRLNASPSIAQMPGESKVPHGNCKSAGYWCTNYKIESPDRPDAVFLWAEKFAQEKQVDLVQMLSEGYDINFYIGVFANVLAVGFDLPPTPTLWKLKIPVGIEFFSS